MNDGLHVWSVTHDFKMKQNFAGSFSLAGDLVAVHVDGTNIFGLHEAFADLCWRAQNFVFADSDADVAIVRGGKAFGVQTTSDFADVFFKLTIVDSAVPV